MRISLVATASLLLAPYAAAWGGLGHRTVALLAKKYLDADTFRTLDEMLKNDRGFEFDDAALWADKIRQGSHAQIFTKPWHYINVDDVGEDKQSTPTSCKVSYPLHCESEKKGGCIISAISNQTALFLSSRSSSKTRREALMFLMHFLGDLHQPLHVEHAFKGGNKIEVRFRQAHINLHKVWDTYIPNKINGLSTSASEEEEKATAADWADRLYALNEASGVSAESECSNVLSPNECSLNWAQESNDWICKFVFQPNVAWLENEDNDLSSGYYDGAVPIVEMQIGKAGARLGAWLNGINAQMKRDAERGGRKDESLGQKILQKEEM